MRIRGVGKAKENNGITHNENVDGREYEPDSMCAPILYHSILHDALPSGAEYFAASPPQSAAITASKSGCATHLPTPRCSQDVILPRGNSLFRPYTRPGLGTASMRARHLGGVSAAIACQLSILTAIVVLAT